MPELPEVETIRQDLRRKILNVKIVRVEALESKSVGGQARQFARVLTGNTITDIERRGKLMIFRLAKGRAAVLAHLKMTGQLIYRRIVAGSRRRGGDERGREDKIEIVAGGHKLAARDIECLPNKHTRVVLAFANGGQLFFNDLRRFGYMKLANPAAVKRALKKFGPEPLTKLFTGAYFSDLFKKRSKTTIKALLLNQERVAGLGNIYVDEACFCAGVRPNRRVGSITIAEQKKLFACIPKILKLAIKHRGTTFRNFLDALGRQGNYTDFLWVYDRDGKECKRCGAIIKKIKAAGRGTHFCSRCQK